MFNSFFQSIRSGCQYHLRNYQQPIWMLRPSRQLVQKLKKAIFSHLTENTRHLDILLINHCLVYDAKYIAQNETDNLQFVFEIIKIHIRSKNCLPLCTALGKMSLTDLIVPDS
jgi:hypothetical protein